MTTHLLSAKLTGDPGPSCWSRVLDVKPQDPQRLGLRGHLFSLICATSDTTPHSIFDALEKAYFESDVNKTSFDALKDSVAYIVNNFDLYKSTVVAVSIVEGTLYAAIGGEAQIFLARDNNLVSLINTKFGEQLSLSGYIQNGDTLLIATHAFVKKFTPQMIQSALQTSKPWEAMETFAPQVRAELDAADIAALVIRCEEEQTAFADDSESTITLDSGIAQEGWRGKVLGVIDSLLARLPQHRLIVRRGPSDYKSRQQRLAVVIGIALIVILGMSVVIGVKKKDENTKRALYEQQLSSARRDLEEARSLKDISSERARELLLHAQQTVVSLKNDSAKTPELDLVTGAIVDSLGAIAGLYRVSPELFLDLGLISSNFKIDQVSYSEGNLAILDKSSKKLIEVTLATKKTQVAAGPSDVEGTLDMALYDDRPFLLKDDGIYEVRNKPILVVHKEWGDAKIFAFAGNLYVLDKSVSQIYRYPGSGGSFGTKANWLATDVKPQFGSVNSWAIDGSIWTLQNGNLSKYSLGKKDAFVLPSDITQPQSFYTDENTDGVYILNKDQGKITLVDKRGQYKVEYEDEVIRDTTQIIVDVPSKKMLLMAGSKIYSIELRHL